MMISMEEMIQIWPSIQMGIQQREKVREFYEDFKQRKRFLGDAVQTLQDLGMQNRISFFLLMIVSHCIVEILSCTLS